MSAAEAESTKKAAPRVVVAEDEALNRMDIVESLESAGYEVVGEAANGQEAVDLVKKTHPDVVVMDIKMPVKDGITAAREINEEFIAPVVMLTAFSQKDLVAEAVDAGVMAYLVKPFVPGKLFPTIEVAMQRWQQMVALRGRLSGISPEQTAAEGSDEEVAKLREQVEDLKGRLESRKHVDRAKGLLMEHMGLTEQEAFRWIQKTSMDRRLTMQEVADAVIAQIEGDELED
ncbi:ANTAR domain-containing response regulator [Pseudoscardovia suis]|jgi:response regulator NasT|uniref:Transcriptional regulator n=1 Tax=Pseudoscardovia suis TaxID=987063 RepID=A0A261EYI1_9BIFI|nr:response regulator [Pseudoscardovia suis]OZG51898.1 transcriptional regulator [Pseudoscardovia suis]PJJ69504.1 response regulator NasT [Pseudoscardovia suis]